MSEEVTDTVTAPVEESATQAEATPVAPSLRDAFAEKLGDDFKSFEKYKDDESLINGIMSAQQMIGKKGDIPAEDADDETKAEFWKKMGLSDEMDITLPEFGEEFGDLANQLPDYYGGIKDQILEIAKDVIPKSGNVNEMLNGIMNEFVKRDADATRIREAENMAAQKDMLEKVAAKNGISADQLSAKTEEIMNRQGWSNETHFTEVLLEFAKMTENSTELKDAHLHNTTEGLDTQIRELSASDEYLRMTGPKHDIAVSKVRELLNKKAQLENK